MYMVTEMVREYRTDDPKLNPTMRVDAKRRPRRDHRALRADSADPKRDSADRLRARQDEALAGIRDQHKVRKGVTRDDLGQGPSKADAQPTSSMTAADAAEAIKAQSKGGQ